MTTTRNQTDPWAATQVAQYRDAYPRYQNFAAILRAILEQHIPAIAPECVVQTRPKSIASFAEKIQRKRGKYHNPVHQLTDLCGARVIVRTRADVRRVCDWVTRHFVIDQANSEDTSRRMAHQEFGYRSWHYIIQLPRDAEWLTALGLDIPEELYAYTAEVQIRTFMEHAWSVMTHDTIYKGTFEMPRHLARLFHSLAALVENADDDFERIQQELAIFDSTYGNAMSRQQLADEIALLTIVQDLVPTPAMAARIGKLAICLEEWGQAIAILRPHADADHPAVLRDLGIALCKHGQATGDAGIVDEGVAYLRRACEAADHRDIDALTALGRHLLATHPEQAHACYDRAFQQDPTDPYLLESLLTHAGACEREGITRALLAPLLRQSITRCRAQAAAGVNLPWAYYSIGLFSLWLGDVTASLCAYAHAISLTPSAWMLASASTTIERHLAQQVAMPGLDMVQRLLLLGMACRFTDAVALDALRGAASPTRSPMSAPVLMLSGACDIRYEDAMQAYLPLVRDALTRFAGTLISGGTTAGISGLAGALQAAYPDQVTTIGYTPASLPPTATLDRRYTEIRTTQATAFSALEALQGWTDLVADGIDPATVTVLGISGGAITRAELCIALALGATVGVVDASGRASSEMLDDPVWAGSSRLVPLPRDAAHLAAFLDTGHTTLSPGELEHLACAVHEEHRRSLLRDLQSPETGADPALWAWSALDANDAGRSLKQSSLAHVRHIEAKLRRLGYTLHRIDDGTAPPCPLTTEEVEYLAELEHARWTIERLRAGWRYGDKKDTARKISPHLVPWEQLSDEVKQWDRDLILGLPAMLAQAGYGVVRG